MKYTFSHLNPRTGIIIFGLLMMATLFISSCKKDNPEPEPQPENPGVNPTPTDPYAANIALISPGAEYYFIADVSGIPGVTKINWQLSTVPGCTTDAYNGVCNGNEYHTGYIVGHDVQPDYFWFVVFFQTTASTGFSNLVHTGDYDFCTPADPKNGIDISFLDANYYDWRCRYVDNNALQSSNFEVTKMETEGYITTIEARFNCQLKHSSTSAVITLSNAVFRAHWTF